MAFKSSEASSVAVVASSVLLVAGTVFPLNS